MEWVGFISLLIILFYSSYPDKVIRLERKVKCLERNAQGGNNMSKIISSLIGKVCKIEIDGMLFSDNAEGKYTVVDADDEWIKVNYHNKKNNLITKILRIDSIENIEIIEN